MLHRLNRNNAQSMIEYVTVATLVMIGILVMGPYVTRSINAFFKNIEDDVDDAFKEEMTQGDPSVELPDCYCTNLVDQACGGGGCNSRQMWLRRDCYPLGCEIAYQAANPGWIYEDCEYRDYCCTNWAETGLCGVNATVPGACPNGEMEYEHYCGAANTRTVVCQSTCQGQVGCPAPPHPLCIFFCTDTAGNEVTPAMLPFASYCTDDTTDLPGNLVVTFVPNGACTDPLKCEAECYSGFVPAATWGCTCPPHSHAVGNHCVCDPGYFFRDGCNSDECLQDGCPAGRCYGILF